MLQSLDAVLRVGPYVYRVTTPLPEVAGAVSALYSDFPRAEPAAFVDYSVAVVPRGRFAAAARQALFRFDDVDQFAPVDRDHAFATLEWGMNWCVSVFSNEYLKLHAAVVARNNGAIILPGVPGAGKSTLCALLSLAGWRVLSDEHALITPDAAEVTPLYRPISLKNESIDLIAAHDDRAVFGPVAKDTHKGTVAHLKADSHPDTFDTEPLPVRALVFPRYSATEEQSLTRFSKTRSFMIAALHSFNYSLLGSDGFTAMRTLIDPLPCYTLTYHDPDWAVKTFDHLASEVQ